MSGSSETGETASDPRLGEDAAAIVDAATRHTAARGVADVDLRHLLWAATQHDPTRGLLARAGTDPDELAAEIGDPDDGTAPPLEGTPRLSPESLRALVESQRISERAGADHVDAEHLLVALAESWDTATGRPILTVADPSDEPADAAGVSSDPGRSRAVTARSAGVSPTPTLDACGHDLTALAREGRLDPVVGRDEQVDQIVEILSRRTKNNPVLVGEPGVGRTAVVEALARRVADGDVPDTLAGRRVIQLDLSGMGSKDTEATLAKAITEIQDFGEELVVFLPDLHTLIAPAPKTGPAATAVAAAGSTDSGNLLMPALTRGELHVIGATTPEEYRRQIEKVPSLESRLMPVPVPEPTVEETVEILRALRPRYEAHHDVRITDDGLLAAARLAHRYIPDRALPDKALDLVDRAAARARLRSLTPGTDVRALERTLEGLEREKNEAVRDERYERALELREAITAARDAVRAARAQAGRPADVGLDCVAEIVSQVTGIAIEQLVHSDRRRLQVLEDELRAGVVGQEEAIAAVSEAIRRARAGLSSPRRPIGSFLFLGPSGVGKTELARALARSLFGGDDRLVRLDLSGFTDAASAARLVGAPVGFTGSGDAGYLTEAVRRRPYSVLLLDQVDKVHPDVVSTLLTLLDEGRLVDGVGRTVDFRNTVVIMTSGVAAEILSTSSALGFGATRFEDDPDHLHTRVLAKLRERFRPEFLNRLDEIVMFGPLSGLQLRDVTAKLLEETEELLRQQEVTLSVEPSALDWLVGRGSRPEAGARRMRRTIQREIDNRLSALLLDGTLAPGGHVTVTAEDGRLEFAVG